MHGAATLGQRLQIVRKRFIGEDLIGPQRVAAAARHLDAEQHRSAGRARQEAEIGVPSAAEHADAGFARLL